MPAPLDPGGADAARVAVAARLERVRDDLRPLDLGAPATNSSSERVYFRHYGLDAPVRHHFGTVSFRATPSGEDGAGTTALPLAVHVFRPGPGPGVGTGRATVFLVHGYYDHTGVHARAIGALIEAGYAVVAFDLPGHGLSGGPRVEIAEIADYARALAEVFDATREHVPAPRHFVGHSTGCVAVLDPLLVEGADAVPYDRIVLVAPLVRSAYWGVSRLGSEVTEWFTDDVARKAREDSSDEEFLRFRRYEDPLQYDRFPLAWFDALEAWQERIAAGPATVDRPLLVLQGENDDIVSWDYNLEHLAERFPRATVVRFPEGNHQLLNEAEDIRTRVFAEILGWLERGERSVEPPEERR